MPSKIAPTQDGELFLAVYNTIKIDGAFKGLL